MSFSLSISPKNGELSNDRKTRIGMIYLKMFTLNHKSTRSGKSNVIHYFQPDSKIKKAGNSAKLMLQGDIPRLNRC
jgi:hypothetical protein